MVIACREAKCSHVASAQVKRPRDSAASWLSRIDQRQWPHVGFSMHVQADEKYLHRTHIRLFIAHYPFFTLIIFPPSGARQPHGAGRGRILLP